MKQVDFSKFTPQEQREYDASKMAYRDIKNSIDTAKREGKKEGLAEGMENGERHESAQPIDCQKDVGKRYGYCDDNLDKHLITIGLKMNSYKIVKIFLLLTISLFFVSFANASNLLFQDRANSSWRGGFINMKLPYDANVVNVIYQDKNGLIWIGTKRGLVNYNGFNYHLCYYGKNKPDENTVQAIIQTDATNLYVGSDNGIRKLNLSTWKYEAVNSELSKVGAVRSLALFDGKLWIGTRDSGLCYYDLKTTKINRINLGEFRQKIIFSLLPVSDQLFIGYYGGLNIYDKKNHKFSSVNLSSFGVTVVNSLVYDAKHHCIWIGTDGKLLQYDLLQCSIKATLAISGTFLKSIVLDDQYQCLLIATEKGLVFYNLRTRSMDMLEHDVHNSRSLCNNLVSSLYNDQFSNLWVATDNGISMAQQSPVLQEVKLSDITNSKKGNLFTCMLSSSENEYWLGGENGLLHVTNGQTIWYCIDNEQYKLVNNNVRAIYRDRSNEIWIATDGGVAKLDRATMQFVFYKIGNKHNNTNWTYGLYEDSLHRMWIATYMSGLIVVDKAILERSNKTACDLNAKNFFARGDIMSVYQMAPDYKGNIWASTDKGLICINPLNQVYRNEKIYLDNFICDGKTIWFSDQGAIYKYDTQTKHKTKLDYHVSYGSVYSMVCDFNRLWLSSIDGICSVDKRTLKVYPTIKEDAYYKCAMYENKSRKIIFGGEDCLAILNLNKIDARHQKKEAFISAISCDTLLIPVVKGAQKSIELPSYRNISIELAALDYASHGNSFYYKWKEDKEWKKMKVGNNLLEYPVMPSGKNMLMISLTNPEVDKSALISSYRFDIPYPWYLSFWAWCSYVIMLIGGVAFVLRMQKRKSERLFEQKAKEKTLELARMKMDFFVNVSHELKTPLSLVIGPLGKLLSECTNAKMRDNLKGIQRNALKLNSLIYKIIDDKQNEYDSENTIIRSHVELVSLLNNCITSFSSVVTERQLKIDFSCEIKELWLNVDVVKMESVFTNLLSNAIKHVDGHIGHVWVSLKIEKDDIVLVSVKDNGCGIEKSELPLIFMKHYQGKAENPAYHGTGIGLFLVKKYVEMHQGTVTATNDGGAVFTVLLPQKGNNLENEIKRNIHHSIEGERDSLPKILVIDDNREVVDFLCSSLSEKYNCLTAFNGKEGLEVMEEHLVDLVIVDEMMPVMNGLEFVRNVKHHIQKTNVPIIMLTAKDDFSTELKSIKAGVDVFISKPFDFNKLMLQVARLIKHAKDIQKAHHIETIMKEDAQPIVETSVTSDELFMKSLLKTIDANLAKEGFNVSMLADVMGVEQKQLYRKVKQLTGNTPVVFLRSIRLKRAAELLKQNRFSVSEVMFMVGISNASYFSKCFTNEFGVTPKLFVQEHSQQ